MGIMAHLKKRAINVRHRSKNQIDNSTGIEVEIEEEGKAQSHARRQEYNDYIVE